MLLPSLISVHCWSQIDTEQKTDLLALNFERSGLNLSHRVIGGMHVQGNDAKGMNGDQRGTCSTCAGPIGRHIKFTD